jgi:hypothetical protein
VPHPIHVAYDEWNVWFREMNGAAGLGERDNFPELARPGQPVEVEWRLGQTGKSPVTSSGRRVDSRTGRS